MVIFRFPEFQDYFLFSQYKIVKRKILMLFQRLNDNPDLSRIEAEKKISD